MSLQLVITGETPTRGSVDCPTLGDGFVTKGTPQVARPDGPVELSNGD